MQSMSGWSLKKPVHSAMSAKVGAAARPSGRNSGLVVGRQGSIVFCEPTTP
jgi:hypothetical protein